MTPIIHVRMFFRRCDMVVMGGVCGDKQISASLRHAEKS
jgi:hypothetical protein